MKKVQKEKHCQTCAKKTPHNEKGTCITCVEQKAQLDTFGAAIADI